MAHRHPSQNRHFRWRNLRFLNGGVLRNINIYSFEKLYPVCSATWLRDALKTKRCRKYSLINWEMIFFLAFLGIIWENKPAPMVSVLQVSYVYQINTLGSSPLHALSHYHCHPCNNSSAKVMRECMQWRVFISFKPTCMVGRMGGGLH